MDGQSVVIFANWIVMDRWSSLEHENLLWSVAPNCSLPCAENTKSASLVYPVVYFQVSFFVHNMSFHQLYKMFLIGASNQIYYTQNGAFCCCSAAPTTILAVLTIPLEALKPWDKMWLECFMQSKLYAKEKRTNCSVLKLGCWNKIWTQSYRLVHYCVKQRTVQNVWNVPTAFSSLFPWQ